MHLLRTIIFGCVLSAAAMASENAGLTSRQMREQWNGSWSVSPKFNDLLGFDREDSRLDAALDHPSAFTMTVYPEADLAKPNEQLQHFRAFIFDRMNHEIVGTGSWITEFEVDPGIETNCIFTEYEGATFVWVGAPYIGFYGGKVSFIRGVDASHDVMVIDFNPTMTVRSTSDRTPDTVAYGRVVKHGESTAQVAPANPTTPIKSL